MCRIHTSNSVWSFFDSGFNSVQKSCAISKAPILETPFGIYSKQYIFFWSLSSSEFERIYYNRWLNKFFSREWSRIQKSSDYLTIERIENFKASSWVTCPYVFIIFIEFNAEAVSPTCLLWIEVATDISNVAQVIGFALKLPDIERSSVLIFWRLMMCTRFYHLLINIL